MINIYGNIIKDITKTKLIKQERAKSRIYAIFSSACLGECFTFVCFSIREQSIKEEFQVELHTH